MLELNPILHPGDHHEDRIVVEEKHLASHVGSGSARVLATPWMIGFMERVSHQLIAQRLPEGYSSVGVMVNVRHLAPSVLGSVIQVSATVISVEKNRVTLKVEARDQDELIGEGIHERVIIEIERFLKRVAAKQARG